MKQILNNILNANSWLFLELVIITIVAWAVFEPAVVNYYYRSLPLNYDSEQLLYAETEVNGDVFVDENGTPHDAWEMMPQRHQQMLRQLMAVEGVESAYLYTQSYGSVGYSQPTFNYCRADGDTLLLNRIGFTNDSHFFETYGLKPLTGSPSAEELSHISKSDQQVVLTRSAAISLFGTADVVGRQFSICYQPEYKVTIAGVVEDFRPSMSSTMRSIILMPEDLNHTECRYVIRLKKGLDASRFVEEHGQELIRSGRTTFNRICRLKTFEDYLKQLELDDGRTQEVNRSLALALFFLVNLILAVIGTVWLHAKRRTEECGVCRAFGATKLRLLFNFLWKNVVLTTAAVIIGCAIYLNYAHSGIQEYDGEVYYETLYSIREVSLPADKTWVDYFWSHFLVVSAVVYLVLIVTVIIGTAIPAVKIIRTKITEALREE